MDRKLLKQNARLNFKKKYGESIVVALIMGLFSGGASSSVSSSSSSTIDSSTSIESGEASLESFEEFLSFIPEGFIYTFLAIIAAVVCTSFITKIFVKPIFTVGGHRFFLKLRKDVSTGIGEVTGNFKDGNYWNIIKISFLKNFKIALWTLLFIIPGIIKAYEYYLVDHILAVRPDIDSKEAFKISKNLMRGYKCDAFVFELSFIGWQILNTLTIGMLGIFYVNPYVFAAHNEFYSFVRIDGLNKGIITQTELPDYELVMPNGINNQI
jgi:uncharacterized membrane protein